MKACGVNKADTFQRQGRYPPPKGASEIMGLEIAGIVEESNSESWKKGDRVMGLIPGGGYAEFCVVPASTLMSIPENLSFVQAAGIPEVFYTAFQALVWIGGLSDKTQNIIIHAGASGVGTAAIQVARQLHPKVKIFVTASSQKKIDFCKELGANDGVNYKECNEKWLEPMQEKMGGKECCNIIIDFIAASYFSQNLEILAQDGIDVLLATLGGKEIPPGSDMGLILKKRLCIQGTNLRARDLDYKAKLTKEINDKLMPLFKDGKIKPIIDQEFKLDDVAKAHETLDSNKTMGKIILTMD